MLTCNDNIKNAKGYDAGNTPSARSSATHSGRSPAKDIFASLHAKDFPHSHWKSGWQARVYHSKMTHFTDFNNTDTQAKRFGHKHDFYFVQLKKSQMRNVRNDGWWLTVIYVPKKAKEKEKVAVGFSSQLLKCKIIHNIHTSKDSIT